MNKKTIIISGATSGIGLATAKKFAENDYDVWCLARKKPDNFEFNFVACDVSDVASIELAKTEILSKVEHIDAVICNAGIGIGGALENTPYEDVKKIFDVNFFGAFELARAFIPKMKEQKSGKILFISSVGSIFPLPFQAMYSATKSALETMAYAWRMELSIFQIQVGCILPGDTKTGFTQNRKNNYATDSDYLERDKKSVQSMEKDEQNGISPDVVAKVIFKQIKRKKLAPRKIVGCKFKLFAFVNRLVPQRFMLWVVKKLYG